MILLDDYLRPLGPQLDPELISPESFRRILKIARRLPGVLASNLFGFECCLGADTPAADFLVCATAAHGRRELLDLLGSSAEAARELLAHPVWRAVAAFVAQWSDPASLLHTGADRVWLEFDVDGGGDPVNDSLPIPSVFFGPEWGPASIPDGPLAVTERALSVLTERPLPVAVRERIATCFRALPPGARIHQVGAMLSRPSDVFRLCVEGLLPEQVVPYLGRIGWEGNAGDLDRRARQLSSVAMFASLDVDVGETILPKVGLECAGRQIAPDVRGMDWPLLMEHLVAAGLCTPARHAMIRAYEGYLSEATAGDLWPAGLRRAAGLVGPRAINLFVRGIHHVKLTYRPDQPVEAKAYLGAKYRWYAGRAPEEAEERLASGREQARRALVRLARAARREELALTCRIPPSTTAYPYGDLVPLGFLLNALSRIPAASAEDDVARDELRQQVLSRRQGLLWSYHSGGLVTSIDSALILQGLADREAVEALERFSDGAGGYYPQLWGESESPDTMRFDPAIRHWCQADFTTTCLVRALRDAAGLPPLTPLACLEKGFERRSGLYFANPYLADWALALALRADPAAGPLKARLAAEIRGSVNADGTFGQFDVALSTACAILALALLGLDARALRELRLRLLDLMEPEGTWPETTPFYSTRTLPRERVPAGILTRALLGEARWQLIVLGEEIHGIYYYSDPHRMVSTALAALAFVEDGPGGDAALPGPAGSPHPRYRCRHPTEYVRRFALPPYLEGR